MKIILQILIAGSFFLATLLANAANEPASLNNAIQLLSDWRQHNPVSWFSFDESNGQKQITHFDFLNFEDQGEHTWRILVEGLVPGNSYRVLIAPAPEDEHFLAYFFKLNAFVKCSFISAEANTRIWSALTKSHLDLAELAAMTRCCYVTNNGPHGQLLLRWNQDLWPAAENTKGDAKFEKIFALTFGADGRPLRIDETTIWGGQTNLTGGEITLVSTNNLKIAARVPKVDGFVRDDEFALLKAFQVEERATPIPKNGYLIAGLAFGVGGIFLTFVKRSRMRIISPKSKRWLQRMLLATFIILAVPPLQVMFVAIVDPPTTIPTVLCKIHRIFSRDHSPVSYHWIAINDMPRSFLKSVWIFEDRHFFEHRGFDWEEVKNARKESIETGRPPRGASTISQQCARSLFLWPARSWLRKGLECYYTIWMELILKKRRILELYANSIEFGDGVYGLEAGAQKYYKVHARDLSQEQSALLVSVMPHPIWWDLNNPDAVELRRKEVIKKKAHNVLFPLEAWNSCVLSNPDTNILDKSGFISEMPAQHEEQKPMQPVTAQKSERDVGLKEVVAHQSTSNILTARTINLEPYVNCDLTNSFVPKRATNNNLKELPVGVHDFGGIPFLVTGRIQLSGTGLVSFGVKFTNRVSEIAIEGKCKNIHLLHGALFADHDGIKIATLVLHYKDGSKKEMEIITGWHVLDWWGETASAADSSTGMAPGSELAWVGSNPYIRERHTEEFIRLYKSTFKNPQPDVEVLSVDYISAETSTAPFLLGLTIE